jgi:hypothetical protein
VLYRLGKVGVFYGNKFGYAIPWCRAFSLPYTFFLLNGDMELNKNRQIFVNNIL